MSKRREDMTITRSAGTPVNVAGIPWLVGAGYEGKTKELDATVLKGAEMLQQAFGRAIVIRFNCDRESGGAFIKDNAKGLNSSCQVGLCAGLRKIVPPNWTKEERLEALIHDRPKWERLPEKVVIDTYVSSDVLKDPTSATEGLEDGHYSSVDHDSHEAAIQWLKDHVDQTKLAEVPGT